MKTHAIDIFECHKSFTYWQTSLKFWIIFRICEPFCLGLGRNKCIHFDYFDFFLFISDLNWDIKQNNDGQNKAVLGHYIKVFPTIGLKVLFQHKRLSLEVKYFKVLKAIDSPTIALPSIQPRFATHLLFDMCSLVGYVTFTNLFWILIYNKKDAFSFSHQTVYSTFY